VGRNAVSDALPTVWDIEPHTVVKHAILRRYLEAWLPILTQQSKILQKQFGTLKSREILFIDGFAGPGEYSKKEPGSPVIALQAAIHHSRPFPIPVRMLFIEHRPDRFAHLQRTLGPLLEQAKSSQNVLAVDARQGDCDTVLNEMLDTYDARQIKFGPALAFLDQFGYGAVSMNLISRILSYPQCEVFTYLSYKEMNRWISDDHKSEAFTRAFGGEEWRMARTLPERQRRQHLLASYKDALRARAGAKYVVSFLMFDQNNSPLYWLLFCTNNLRGLEEMKKAMWFVDKTGSFRFSDSDEPAQLKLLEQCFDQSWLAERLRSDLQGRTMTASEVKEFVLSETPCYLFKTALSALEADKAAAVIDSPAGRKPGKFPDSDLGAIKFRFGKPLF
jgi:three-Cys-motif partner protein